MGRGEAFSWPFIPCVACGKPFRPAASPRFAKYCSERCRRLSALAGLRLRLARVAELRRLVDELAAAKAANDPELVAKLVAELVAKGAA
jgi:hypothetical protein